MPCTHKFYLHPSHLAGDYGLLPAWEFDTLIIGTFNPEESWHPKNTAKYFYGRARNYFWRILPLFVGEKPIHRNDVDSQISFLRSNRIGITDLLIRVNDADIGIKKHEDRIQTVLDADLELFEDLHWNTDFIISYINEHPNVRAIYFTKLGSPNVRLPLQRSFEFQIRRIEQAFPQHIIHRLHTPSGQGLGFGRPRRNVLINRWYRNNGGDEFPFLRPDFDIEDYRFE